MTVTYGFYDSLAGDRKYNASQMSRLFDGIITDGIFQSVGAGFVVSANAGMTLNVGSGRAWLNYTWTYNDTNFVVTVLASEVALNRIDTVVIEVNTDIAVRANSIKVIKGTPASSPVAPTLSNTATLKQYPLADIYVGLGVTSINSGNITNRVAVGGGTPFITGILTSFDVATLFGQYTANFNTWFTNLVNQLSGSQVTNLQNEIDQLVSGWIPAGETWTYASADAPTFTFTVPTDLTSKYRAGRKIKLTQTTDKYFIVTKVSYSSPNTTVTLYGGTDFVLANAAITAPFYSRLKAPLGFPLEPSKWSVIISDTADRSQANPTINVWTNPGGVSITVPIGAWELSYALTLYGASNAAQTNFNIFVTLGTLNNNSYAPAASAYAIGGPSGSLTLMTAVYKSTPIELATKQQYFLNVRTTTGNVANIIIYGAGVGTTVLRAVCAYL